jgi:hypothetical protein
MRRVIRLRRRGAAAKAEGMGFFDDQPPPEPERPRPYHPWDEPPEAEFPGIVPIQVLPLGRTQRAAVAVTGISDTPPDSRSS